MRGSSRRKQTKAPPVPAAMPRATTSKALLLLGCAVALAAAGARGAVLTTAVGDYEPTSDMDMSELCGLSDAVSKIKDLLGAESPDFDAIKAAYEDGAQALATADYSGTMYFDMNAAYFNSTTWIDDYILSAIEDTIPGADLSARLEIIEKARVARARCVGRGQQRDGRRHRSLGERNATPLPHLAVKVGRARIK